MLSECESFKNSNEWKQWSIIKKVIKRKGGKTPGFWITNRKKLLGLVKVS